MTKLTIEGQELWDMAEIEAYTARIGKPVKLTTIRWYRDVGRLVPAARVGHMDVFAPETVKAFFRPDRKPGVKHKPSPRGYYSTDELAAALGVESANIHYFLRVGAIKADYVPTKGQHKGRKFFNEDTLQAMKRGEHRLRQAGRDETDDETPEED